MDDLKNSHPTKNDMLFTTQGAERKSWRQSKQKEADNKLIRFFFDWLLTSCDSTRESAQESVLASAQVSAQVLAQASAMIRL